MRNQIRYCARKFALAGLVSVTILLLGTASLSAQVIRPNWTYTGSLNVARQAHTATLLQTGKVLVVGGWDGTGATRSAELYDPATGSWSMTGSLSLARDFFTATLLQNGKEIGRAHV